MPPNGRLYETVDANWAVSLEPFQITRCGVKTERLDALLTNWNPYTPDCRICIGPAQPFAPVAALNVPSHQTSALNVRRENAGVPTYPAEPSRLTAVSASYARAPGTP